MVYINQARNGGTTARDFRFTSTNQANHCWNRYNEWLVCANANGGLDDEDNNTTCIPLRQMAVSVCPGFWVENWDEQRELGTFSGVNSRFDIKKDGHH